MKLFPRRLSDDKGNEYWRVKASHGQVVVKAVSRQRDKAEQLAEDLTDAWDATDPKQEKE